MDNYNYPEGADTADAPWNQCDQPDEEVEITVYESLYKNDVLCVNDYTREPAEYDEDDGVVYMTPGGIDFTDCDFLSNYKENKYTASESLKEAVAFAKLVKHFVKDEKIVKQADKIIDICSGWKQECEINIEYN